jgi:hypothetical protein
MKCFVNGVDTASFDFELVDLYIPPLPTLEDYNVKLASRDGEIDLGSVFGPRVIQTVFFVTDYTSLEYHQKIAKAAAVFNPKKGDQSFTFDGEFAGKRYMARVAATIPFNKGSQVRTFSIPLKMHMPYPEAVSESIKELTLTSSPENIQIDVGGNVETPPLIVIQNIGSSTINGFTIANEYLVEE